MSERAEGADKEIIWQASYDDGSSLWQVGPDGERRKYPDIDRSKLMAFDLWQGGKLLVRVDMRDDSRDGVGPKRLIWRKRTEKDSLGRQSSVHLVGWQRVVGGVNVQAICYVFANGAVVMGGQFNERDPLMYPVKLQAQEKT